MRHIATVVVALAATTLLVPSAQAGTRTPIEITDVRVITSDVGDATTDLAGCESADSVDVRARAEFTLTHGQFQGIRDFQCDDGVSGFVVRLTASFGDGGSIGWWSIVDSYGDLAGLHGAGMLVGTPVGDDGISDHYTGWVTWS